MRPAARSISAPARAGTIDGVEYGVDGGSFGYLNNYLTAGKKVGNFEYSLFASDARGDGFIQNSWFNTQTVNFLGTLQATPDDRFTVKFINNNLDTRLPIRSSLNQFYQNPFQAGCDAAGVAGCGSVPLFNNGFNGARKTMSPRCRPDLAATIAAPSSAAAGSTISTTRRPGETSSCSTTATSASRPARPARSAISRRTTT